MIPRELGFHTGVGGIGLPDLLEGRVSLGEFAEVMSDHWWQRTAPWDSRISRGLYKTIPEDRFNRCLQEFVRAYPSDAVDATRTLMRGLLDPLAEAAGKPAWVEMDPYNVVAAQLLYRVFPDLRFIHIMRDGRDVAASIADLPWGRDGDLSGIWRWQRILREGHAELQELPPDRVLTIRLEDLVENRRGETYARLLDFLELEDEAAMHALFDCSISPQRAHVGRRRSRPRLQRLTATAVYACALGRLAIAGVSPRPRLLESKGPARKGPAAPQSETIDPWADGAARDA